VLLSVSGRTAKPHTTHEPHVMQMRDLTCCSYVSLIVDTRNITGRHRTGNAWASWARIPPLNSGSLLKRVGPGDGRVQEPIVVQQRTRRAAFGSHIRDSF
jgi:hypothetical protein